MGRLPTIYLPHGGGPWPFVDVIGSPEEWRPLRAYLEKLYASILEPIKAVVCVTAHFEGSVVTVGTGAAPKMLYDYGGFPPEAYQLKWPAPGHPEVASRIGALLSEAGLEHAEAPDRGFDHGTFVPLKLADPHAQVPTVQLSLRRDLDPSFHLDLGRALAPLRDEGVLLLGSGSSYHNMRRFGTSEGRGDSIAFDAWLSEQMSGDAPARRQALARWTQAPSARESHPREEHLIPLHVCAGAAEPSNDRASFPFEGFVLGAKMRAVQFG